MENNPTTTDASTSNRDLLVKGPTPANDFVFEEGDTIILVTYEGASMEGLVCSQSVSRASPVLKKFIFPPWGPQDGSTQSDAQQQKTIDCREEDGEALLILLNIMHLKFQDVPATSSVEVLHQVASLCEQYQCVSIVAPWVENWILESCQLEKNYAARLSIAWVFGNEKFFKMAAKKLVLLSRHNEDGQLVDSFGCRIDDLLPPGLLESILDVRREAIEALISIPHTLLSRYDAVASPDTPASHICQVQVPWNVREACDSMIHGSLIRSLKRTGYYQKPMNELVKMPDLDLGDFSDNVAELNILHLKPMGGDIGLDDNHSACVTVDLCEEVCKIMGNLRSPVLDSHIEHVRSQREKLGRTKSAKASKKRM